MEWMSAIQKAIAYMEEQLLEEIKYEDVAESVHISEYEFHRAFSFLAGMTANTYIRNRRLSLAGTEVLFNPIVIKIIMEGGISMDYRIVQTKKQKFIALVREFSNEIINDEENKTMKYFWNVKTV